MYVGNVSQIPEINKVGPHTTLFDAYTTRSSTTKSHEMWNNYKACQTDEFLHVPGLPPPTQRHPISPLAALVEFRRAYTTCPARQMPEVGAWSPKTSEVIYGCNCVGKSLKPLGAQSFAGPIKYFRVFGYFAANDNGSLYYSILLSRCKS